LFPIARAKKETAVYTMSASSQCDPCQPAACQPCEPAACSPCEPVCNPCDMTCTGSVSTGFVPGTAN
jgi:hypothetical protein